MHKKVIRNFGSKWGGTFNKLLFILIFPSLISCSNLKSSGHANYENLELYELSGPLIRKIAETAKNNEYLLQKGDVIAIKFFYNPELNEVLLIRPDGKISIQLLGDVNAADLSPSQLDEILSKRYSTILDQHDLTVIVKEISDKRIYVGGEVKNSGLIRTPGNLTALQAIFQAGGFKNTAELRNIVVLRNQSKPQPLFITLNLKKDLKSPTYQDDIVLQNYDIVFVPKTQIAKMNLFVEQYIDKLIPISRSLGLVYNLNPEIKLK